MVYKKKEKVVEKKSAAKQSTQSVPVTPVVPVITPKFAHLLLVVFKAAKYVYSTVTHHAYFPNETVDKLQSSNEISVLKSDEEPSSFFARIGAVHHDTMCNDNQLNLK